METTKINKQDAATLARIQTLHPKLRDEALAIYKEICAALTGKAICRFSYTLRTFAEQNALYAQGRTAKGAKVTNAIGGQSFHNYGLAIDIVLLIDKDGNGTYEAASWDTTTDFDADRKSDWQEIVHIFKMHGWEWGGDWRFKDMPHFQKTFGYTIKQLQFLHNSKKFEKGTTYPIL
jgi:peptidoglycan L-alanyl-D-glutamate endopeptidase CwlK